MPPVATPPKLTTAKIYPAHLAIVKTEFGKCLLVPTFFDDFYREFTSQSAEIRQMFSKTDMTAQKAALRAGLSFLVTYAEGNSAFAAGKLDRIGATHRRSQLNVRPDLYPFWIRSLVKTVQKSLPGFDEKSKTAWQSVLQNGVDRILSHYEN